ncbi:unnamed protein product [Closterium sp. NIES-65]|nr:unnamed protein product [Closterium sp. NIES-65]CAI6009979.1 unnamed protein product [Closterium sp. NIES-65]
MSAMGHDMSSMGGGSASGGADTSSPSYDPDSPSTSSSSTSGGSMSMMMMQMWFYWGPNVIILFESWKTSSWGFYLLACFLVVVFCVLHEFLTSFRLKLSATRRCRVKDAEQGSTNKVPSSSRIRAKWLLLPPPSPSLFLSLIALLPLSSLSFVLSLSHSPLPSSADDTDAASSKKACLWRSLLEQDAS